MSEAIVASELVKTYPPGVRALDGLSFSVRGGEIFGLLGPNGAGKSTTVRVLTTLTRPDAGTAEVAGIDVLAQPLRARRAIGVVGQQHGVDLEATGRENLVLQGEFYGIGGRGLRRRVQQSLERFGLADAADRRVKTYSGGMKRRLDVALGLIHHPEVLFLDEPTTGLDPEVRAHMWQEIERLAHEEGMTILLTTHYLEEADRLAARVAIVDGGRIVVSGTPEELKSGLEGDTIHVALAEGQGAAARDALRQLSRVGSAVVDGDALSVRAHDGAAAVPAVLAALDAHGASAASLTLARPSLDEVYLRHTGRRLRDAERRESNDEDRQEVAA
jgi:ABC-2 type transport system ATP-binding protein